MRAPVVMLVTAAFLLAGCTTPSAVPRSATPTPEERAAPVVIAVLDTGTNAYLPIFTTDAGLKLPSLMDKPVELRIDLDAKNGTILERYRGEEELWRSLEERQLYYIAGTRILAISLASFDAPPVQDGSRHGARTSYLAARDAPEAWIVMVQVDPAACDDRADCRIDPSVAEGMEWIADQPWIDIVSVSIGFPLDSPDSGAVHPESTRFLAASERAARDGKTIVFGAGNDPAPSLMEYFAGPPWVIAVGGVEPEAQGASLMSSKTADVVANFTEHVPGVLTEELEWSSGTSFSAPIVAATLAQALHQVRRAAPERDVSPQELRGALNASAVHFQDPTRWDPVPSGKGPPGLGTAYTTTTPVLLQSQMGWGYVDASLAPEIARRVLAGDLAPPAGKADAARFQDEWQSAREDYWASAPR